MPFVNYKVAAGWSLILPKLSTFVRGSNIGLDWLRQTGDVSDGTSFEGRLRAHFEKQGITVVKRGEVYHLLTHPEQKEHTAGRREHTKREDARALKEITAVDRGELDERGRREADHLQRHFVARREEHGTFEKAHRAILGVPEPRPQLASVKKSE